MAYGKIEVLNRSEIKARTGAKQTRAGGIVGENQATDKRVSERTPVFAA